MMNTLEFSNIDKTFNEAMFMTKVNNIFIKFFTAIMMDNLVEVDHFIGDEVYNYGENILKSCRKNNYRQMYDELNVKSSRINSIEATDEAFIINVYLESRYMDYILDIDSGNLVSGNDSSRIQVDYMLTFIKKRNASNGGIAKKCPACGAPMDVNNKGLCEYCGAIYNQEDYDWVLEKLQVI